MSDFDDATIDDIRNADKETLNRWVAEAKGIGRERRGEGWLYGLPFAGTPGVHAHPPPYASEWWAAGPLLGALQGAQLSDEDQEALLPFTDLCGPADLKDSWGVYFDDFGDFGFCGPMGAPASGGVMPVSSGNTAPEAIARAYLIAVKRGVLKVPE